MWLFFFDFFIFIFILHLTDLGISYIFTSEFLSLEIWMNTWTCKNKWTSWKAASKIMLNLVIVSQYNYLFYKFMIKQCNSLILWLVKIMLNLVIVSQYNYLFYKFMIKQCNSLILWLVIKYSSIRTFFFFNFMISSTRINIR